MSGTAAADVVARLRLANWAAARSRVMPLRLQVFVEEQGVPLEMEEDADDPVSLHAIAEDGDGVVIGTGRLLPDGHIGRVAVAARLRGRGVGARILTALMAEAARRGQRRALLHAQVAAEGFYARLGFERTGDVFMEAGIAHTIMARALDPPA